jgi:hypothetical protein
MPPNAAEVEKHPRAKDRKLSLIDRRVAARKAITVQVGPHEARVIDMAGK